MELGITNTVTELATLDNEKTTNNMDRGKKCGLTEPSTLGIISLGRNREEGTSLKGTEGCMKESSMRMK